MSQRHRLDPAGLPPKQELRAHARAERHRVNTELHSLSAAVGAGVDPDDTIDPGVEWKPVHHHDADRARAQVGRPRRLRHWKLKAWKRRTALRREKATRLRLAAEDA